jgi:hypothetical protein
MTLPVIWLRGFNNHLSFSSQTCKNAFCIFTVTQNFKNDYLHAEDFKAVRTDSSLGYGDNYCLLRTNQFFKNSS